jgi:uncharacterized protein (TIGR03663 family)
MKSKVVYILLFACVLSGGAFLRWWKLADRPMHTDESVHAEKFKALLEDGFYVYDPHEFHGPTLNYVSRISAWLRGEKSYQQIDERTLRIVPAVFGIGLILTPLFFLKGVPLRSILFCSTLIAFSPAFVYYSRYYIQEMLLVFFTACFLGCLWNYTQSRKAAWIIFAGVFLGLMHASKETFVFSCVAVLPALILCAFCRQSNRSKKIRLSHVMLAMVAAVLTSAAFYSSFGANWQGILDSVTTYGIWLRRAGGESVHIHPWYYYLDILTWIEFVEPITWNEDGIVALACIGIGIVCFNIKHPQSRLAVFLGVYTLVLTAIYCVIPYKTPWSMMSFLYGMALVAGLTAGWFLDNAAGRWDKVILGAVLLIYGLAAPMVQGWLLNFHYSSDPENPYVYAHTDKDVFKMVAAVQEAVQASEEGIRTPVYVIAEGKDYWPFPWYLRGLQKVGYWDHVDPSACQAPIILTGAGYAQELMHAFYTVPPPGQKHLYMPLFDQTLVLRPGVEWNGFIRKDLWDRLQRAPELPAADKSLKKTAMESVSDENGIENRVKFSHRAMHTNFEMVIQHQDARVAAQAARAAFREVDRLETLLSHYVENSDVSRINRLAPNETAIVDEDVIRCLRLAQEAYELTDGAFNITIGNLIKAPKHENNDASGGFLPKLTTPEMLEINDQEHSVKVLQKGMNIDLGGIGKGYAVDAAADVLAEWGVQRALIHGGSSSIRAMEPPKEKNGWPVVLHNPVDESVMVRLELANEAMSCSGVQQGGHIINPFTGQPVTGRSACWVRFSENAAIGDAVSTAAMVMPVEKIQAMQAQQPDLSVMLLMAAGEGKDKLMRWGHWPQD